MPQLQLSHRLPSTLRATASKCFLRPPIKPKAPCASSRPFTQSPWLQQRQQPVYYIERPPGPLSRVWNVLFRTEPPPESDPHTTLRRRITKGFISLCTFGFFSLIYAHHEVASAGADISTEEGELLDWQLAHDMIWDGRINAPWYRFHVTHLAHQKSDDEKGLWYTHITTLFSEVDPGEFAFNMVGFSMFLRTAFASGLRPAAVCFTALASGVAGTVVWDIVARKAEVDDVGSEETVIVGSSGIVWGLASASAFAAPRMPFYIGYSPKSIPTWAVFTVGFATMSGILEPILAVILSRWTNSKLDQWSESEDVADIKRMLEERRRSRELEANTSTSSTSNTRLGHANMTEDSWPEEEASIGISGALLNDVVGVIVGALMAIIFKRRF